LHAFGNRLAFYDVLPQGMEMLYVPAFSVGGGSAAKLVHFAFLCALIPLTRELARELGVSDPAGAVAAALVFLAPVSGVAGTSAYTDAGLACAVCAGLQLLLRWKRERTIALLVCAALCAGFCYTVKPTFALLAIFAVIFVLYYAKNPAPALIYAAVCACVVLPWAIRAGLTTGDPFAPFLSRWFPNAISNPQLEHDLLSAYSAFRPSFSWILAPAQYTFAGGHQGLLGAAFLLLPLGLFRRRRLLAISALLALPVLANTGTRFLLPAAVPASIVIAASAGAAAPLVLALQALASIPPVLDVYVPSHEWRLRELPLRAAVGSIPEDEYLHEAVSDFGVVDLIREQTSPSSRILALTGVPDSAVPREVLLYWQSEQGRTLRDALGFADMSRGTRARLLSWRWKCGQYSKVRLTAASELRLVETQIHGGDSARKWNSLAPGSSFQLNTSGDVSGADLLIWPGDQAVENTEAFGATGLWQPISDRAYQAPHTIDLRGDATAFVRHSGFDYILIKARGDAFAHMGADMVQHANEWGLESAGHFGDVHLFRIAP
jgi:hypothetical protein